MSEGNAVPEEVRAAQRAATTGASEYTGGTQSPTLEERRERGSEFVATAQNALAQAEAALDAEDFTTATQLLSSLVETANSLRGKMLVADTTMQELIRSHGALVSRANAARSSEQVSGSSFEASGTEAEKSTAKPGYTATPEITGITVSDSERVPQIIADTASEASSARTQVAAEGASAQEERVAEDSITGGSMPSETSEQSRIPADENKGAEVSSAEAGENGAAAQPEAQQAEPAAQEQQVPAARKERNGIFGWLRNTFRKKSQPNLAELSEAVTAAATPSVAETADVARVPLQRPEREAAPTPETTQAAAEAAPEATTPTATEPIPAAAEAAPQVTAIEAAEESPVTPDDNSEVQPRQTNTPSAETPAPTAVEIAQSVEAAAAERANDIDARRIAFDERLYTLSTEYFDQERATEEVDIITIADLIAQFSVLRTETAALPEGHSKDMATRGIEMNERMLDALVRAALSSNRLMLSESGMYYEAYQKLVKLLTDAFKDKQLDKREIAQIAEQITDKNIGPRPRRSELAVQRKAVREKGVEAHRIKVDSEENRAARKAAVEAAAKKAIEGAVAVTTSGVVLAEKGVVMVETAAATVAGVGDKIEASVIKGVNKAAEVTDAAIATVLSVQAVPFYMRAALGEVAQGVREAYWQVEDDIRKQVVNNAGAAVREVRGIFGGLRQVGSKLKEGLATIGPAFAQVADRMSAQSAAADEARRTAREQTSSSANAANEAVLNIAADREINPRGLEGLRRPIQKLENL